MEYEEVIRDVSYQQSIRRIIHIDLIIRKMFSTKVA